MHPALTVIAQIARTDASGLNPDLTLDRIGLNSSLGLGILRSALERRFKCALGPLTWRTTIGQVLAELDGTEPRQTPAAAEARPPVGLVSGRPGPGSPWGPFAGRTHRPPAPPFGEFGHGVDLQEVAAMPALADGWEETGFYRDHFTASELAGARTRPDARVHLCGLWCAKEAVKKSDPGLASLEFREIVIEHDAGGRPAVRLLRGGDQERISISVSISHSAAYAVASVITLRPQ